MRLGLVAGVAVLVLSGCDGPEPSSGSDFDHVMKDPGATAAEIISAAGPPDQIATNADGSMMLLWTPFIVPETGDTPLEGATAWRLYDAEGQTVATYGSPDREDLSLTATRDGFLLYEPAFPTDFTKVYRVDAAGEQHDVPVDDDRLPTRAGDTFVQSLGVMHFYRPTDRTLHQLLPEPHRAGGISWYGALLDEQGALWRDGYEGDHHWLTLSRDGGRTARRLHLPLEQPGRRPSMPVLALGPGVAAVLTDQWGGGSPPGSRYLDLVYDYGRQVHRVTAKTLPFLRRLHLTVPGQSDGDAGATYEIEPELSVMTDGRVLLGAYDADQWWVAEDASNLEFVRLSVPEHTAFVRDLGGTLFAWADYRHREVPLQTSTDDGATWQTFDVSS